jgi:SnoaL-like domain
MPLSAEDQLAIRDLAARYNHAIDGGHGAAYADTFVDDGVLDAGALLVEGRTALEQFGNSFAGSVRAPRHIATSLVIDGDGDQAELRAYVQMFAMVGEPPRHEVTASGTYRDTLVRLNGHWRFVQRTFTIDE